MRGVHIAGDIMAADTATTAMPIVPMGITAMSIVHMATTATAIAPTDIMVAIDDMATMVAIDDTDIMVAIGPIADTGRGVHTVAGADRRPYGHVELMKA
jgi:hypothetical protein